MAELELKHLRDEIVTRLRMRQQLLGSALVVGGAFLGIGLEKGQVALIYPPLAAFIALGWAQNDARIGQIGKYIRDKIEPVVGKGWESYLREKRSQRGLRSWRLIVVSQCGLFLFTQLLATGVGVLNLVPQWTTQSGSTLWTASVLLFFDVLAIFVVLGIMLLFMRRFTDRDEVPG